MPPSVSKLLVSTLLAVLAIALASVASPKEEKETVVFPDMQLKDRDGASRSISELVAQYPVCLVTFYLSGSPECDEFINTLQEWHSKDEKLGYLIISADPAYGRSSAETGVDLRNFGTPLTLLFDNDKTLWNNSAVQVHAAPDTFVLNSKREIQYRQMAYRGGGELELLSQVNRVQKQYVKTPSKSGTKRSGTNAKDNAEKPKKKRPVPRPPDENAGK